MSRRPRWVNRLIGTAVPLGIAAGTVVPLPSWIGRDAEGIATRHGGLLEELVRPAEARGVVSLDGRMTAFRDRIRPVEDELRSAGEPRNEVSRVRVVRGSAALSGRARVIDGDTLELGGARVRLHGIDAPESAQSCRAGGRFWACGRAATRALAELVRGRPVACEERDRDRYGRVVAVCSVAGQDLNAWMVAEGWAFAYRRYSRAYVGEETRARVAQRGVWRGDAVAPWDWRRGKRLAGTEPATQRGDGRCNIKGNIGRSGKRIYHMPGGRYYGGTRINTSRGERWFCTESEARAAGWRRSRQ